MSSSTEIPSSLNIPLRVKIPSNPSIEAQTHANPSMGANQLVRAVLKYHNEEGRTTILSVAKSIHHDFGQWNQSLSVSVLPEDLEKLKLEKNVEWFEGDGRVFYCSIR
jgi:hypothetical protein|mmetsp:Transcript_5486/g.12178  ORF Transcript_5486/g.12178 Transcript_5486/m.12178 type:complete len:108 (+) Transcript_5486:124-447(+)